MNERDNLVFDTTTYRKTVEKMAAKKERVHTEGERIFRETGKLDQNVNIFGTKRFSRNAFEKNLDDGTATLKNGIKLPIISQTDGTGSMGENVEKAFYAMGKIYGSLRAFERYQIDLSVSVIQDVQDKHPVLQMAEFESDNRAAEHVIKLIPDEDGGDLAEDYDLGLWYVDNCVETDIVRYKLKGYYFLILDAIGRGKVSALAVKTHLGQEMQSNSIDTKVICKNLLEKWHLFCIQVKGREEATEWWTDKIGRSRIIKISDADLLAETQAGLVYVTETIEPNENGLYEFLSKADDNNKITKEENKMLWGWLQQASVFFGAQAKIDGYNKIPKPGDVFANYRDVWPIGHNDESTPEETPPTKTNKIDWGKY